MSPKLFSISFTNSPGASLSIFWTRAEPARFVTRIWSSGANTSVSHAASNVI